MITQVVHSYNENPWIQGILLWDPIRRKVCHSETIKSFFVLNRILIIFLNSPVGSDRIRRRISRSGIVMQLSSYMQCRERSLCFFTICHGYILFARYFKKPIELQNSKEFTTKPIVNHKFEIVNNQTFSNFGTLKSILQNLAFC